MSSAHGVEQPKVPLKIWFTSGVAGMASYLDAAGIVSTGTALVLFQDHMKLSPGQIGQLSSLLTIMIAFGALVGGRLGDKFGRRRVFTVTMIIYAIAAAILMTASAPAALYCGIILLGFAVGADLPVSLATIAEEAPEGTAGKLISFSHMLWMIGMAVTMLIQVFIGGMGVTGARVLYGHLLVVSVVVLVLRLQVPESAKWRAAHTSSAASANEDHIDADSLRRLIKSPWLGRLIALALFYALVNIAANTSGQFTSYIYVNVANSTVQVASAISLFTMAVSFIMTYVLMRVVDTKYRMRAFGICAILNTGGALIPAVFGVAVPTLALMSLIMTIGGAIAGEPMFKVWAQELFPTMLRSSAQGIGIAFTRVIAAIVALWTPAVLDAGPRILYLFIFAVVGIGCAIGYFVLAKLPKADSIAESEDATASFGTKAVSVSEKGQQ